MKINITTTIQTNENYMWKELQKVSSLQYVSFPIIWFASQKGTPVPDLWSSGRKYHFNLRLFGIIPLGRHFIQLAETNQNTNTIRSYEHNSFINVWNHVIEFHEKKDHSGVEYTDEVEIHAGILTLPIWLFAVCFYTYRQYRWRKFFTDRQSVY